MRFINYNTTLRSINLAAVLVFAVVLCSMPAAAEEPETFTIPETVTIFINQNIGTTAYDGSWVFGPCSASITDGEVTPLTFVGGAYQDQQQRRISILEPTVKYTALGNNQYRVGTLVQGDTFTISAEPINTLGTTSIEKLNFTYPDGSIYIWDYVENGQPWEDTSELQPGTYSVQSIFSASGFVSETTESELTSNSYTFSVGQAPAYDISITTDGNGVASASLNSATTGNTVTLTTTAKDGYQFKRWQILSGDVTITDNTFVMPASHIALKAIFSPISSDDEDGATLTVPISSYVGDTVPLIITGTPGETYVLSGETHTLDSSVYSNYLEYFTLADSPWNPDQNGKVTMPDNGIVYLTLETKDEEISDRISTNFTIKKEGASIIDSMALLYTCLRGENETVFLNQDIGTTDYYSTWVYGARSVDIMGGEVLIGIRDLAGFAFVDGFYRQYPKLYSQSLDEYRIITQPTVQYTILGNNQYAVAPSLTQGDTLTISAEPTNTLGTTSVEKLRFTYPDGSVYIWDYVENGQPWEDTSELQLGTYSVQSIFSKSGFVVGTTEPELTSKPYMFSVVQPPTYAITIEPMNTNVTAPTTAQHGDIVEINAIDGQNITTITVTKTGNSDTIEADIADDNKTATFEMPAFAVNVSVTTEPAATDEEEEGDINDEGSGSEEDTGDETMGEDNSGSTTGSGSSYSGGSSGSSIPVQPTVTPTATPTLTAEQTAMVEDGSAAFTVAGQAIAVTIPGYTGEVTASPLPADFPMPAGAIAGVDISPAASFVLGAGETATVGITVSLSDLPEGASPEDAVIVHGTGSNAEELPTTYTTFGNLVTYNGKTDSFSPFILVHKENGAQPVQSEPTEAQSPLSVLAVLGGLGAAGVMLRRR